METAPGKCSGWHFTGKGYLNWVLKDEQELTEEQVSVHSHSRWTADLEVPTVTLLQDLLGRDVIVSEGVAGVAVLPGKSKGAMMRSKHRTGSSHRIPGKRTQCQPERIPWLNDTKHQNQLSRR